MSTDCGRLLGRSRVAFGAYAEYPIQDLMAMREGQAGALGHLGRLPCCRPAHGASTAPVRRPASPVAVQGGCHSRHAVNTTGIVFPDLGAATSFRSSFETRGTTKMIMKPQGNGGWKS
jgi:hypothetical protein